MAGDHRKKFNTKRGLMTTSDCGRVARGDVDVGGWCSCFSDGERLVEWFLFVFSALRVLFFLGLLA